eukprot:scaffold3474_cov246-Pinguiococcus_pyrenoidosus.AAC.5
MPGVLEEVTPVEGFVLNVSQVSTAQLLPTSAEPAHATHVSALVSILQIALDADDDARYQVWVKTFDIIGETCDSMICVLQKGKVRGGPQRMRRS